MLLKIIKNIKTLTGEASWVFLEQAGVVVAGLAGIKLLTAVLDKSEFGYLALANTITALVGVYLFGPFGQGIIRYWSISQSRDSLDIFYKVADRIAKYLFGISVFIIPFAFFLLRSFKSNKWALLVAVSLTAGAFAGLLGLRLGIFTAARQRRRSALLKIACTFSKYFVAVILVILFFPDATIVVAGYLLATIFIFLIAQRFYFGMSLAIDGEQASHNNFSFAGLSKKIFSYSWPFLVWGAFGWMNVSSDKWALQTFHGAEVVGAFAVVSQLANYPLIALSGFLTSFFMPIAFQKAGDLTEASKKASARNILFIMTGVYILGILILVTLFFLLHHTLILLISNENFAKFSYFLPWLTIAWAFFYIGNMLASFGFLANNSRIYILPKIVTFSLTALLAFFMCYQYGAVGVIWGLALPRFIYALWCALIAVKLRKTDLIVTERGDL